MDPADGPELALPPLTPTEGNLTDVDADRHAGLDPDDPDRQLSAWAAEHLETDPTRTLGP